MAGDSGVTVVRSAFYDARFGTLARICGLADSDHARGKLERLWNQCLEEETTSLTRDDVETVLGCNGVEGLVRARLGRELEDGRVYLAGTTTGKRVTWLGEARQQASAAGQKSARGRARDEKGRLMPRGVTGDSSETSSDKPTTLDTVGRAETNDHPTVSSPLTPSPSPSPIDQRSLTPRDLLAHAVDRLNKARTAIAPNHLPISKPAIFVSPDGPDGRLMAHLEGVPEPERLNRLEHAIDVLIAEAQGGRGLDHLRLGMLAGPNAWRRLQETTVGGVKQSSKPDARASPASRGQVQAAIVQRQDGEHEL